MQQQPPLIDLSPDSAEFPEPHLLDELQPPLADSSFALAPSAPDDGFPFRAPPSATGYSPGYYLSQRPLLQPLGYSSSSSSYCSSSTYTQTSWSTYNQPPTQFAPANGNQSTSVSQPFGASYSTYPLGCSSYGVLPPPLHHIDSGTVTTSAFAGRKRPRAMDAEPCAPAVKTSCGEQRPATSTLEFPTPPDSSSDHSGTVSPQNYYRVLPIPPPLPQCFPAPPLPQNGVHVTLTPKAEELWNLFYPANTEMIVTKSGRCLFPLLMFSVSGLARKKEYSISIRAVSSDRWRYKFLHSAWTQVSESEYSPDALRMTAENPSSPQSGAKWMAKDVDFKSVKITHYAKSKGGDILLHTMHKYFFEVVVEERRGADSEPLVFPFPLTTFIAVTAYQSAKLTELKKEKNPFARGVKHHESETEPAPLRPPTYDVPSYMAGYNPASLYPSSSNSVPIPYPTPWSQNGQRC